MGMSKYHLRTDPYHKTTGCEKWTGTMRYVQSLLICINSVPHQALLAKLHSLSVNNYLLKWICHYLLDRKQRVVLNSVCSAVVSGVPLGSVLGPLLFLIYFDGITQVPLSLGSFMDLYADDLLLYRIIKEILFLCNLT